MKTGGPLDGLVTISALDRDGSAGYRVAASWIDDRGRRSESLDTSTYAVARALARAAANQLAISRPPRLSRP